jgi:primosomal protein N' (replication factor Y)
MAAVSGEAALAYVEQLRTESGLEVLGPAEGRWFVRADHHAQLCDALATVSRPPGRLRVNVDPSR